MLEEPIRPLLVEIENYNKNLNTINDAVLHILWYLVSRA